MGSEWLSGMEGGSEWLSGMDGGRERDGWTKELKEWSGEIIKLLNL